MPRVLDWLHQEPTEPADLVVRVAAGIGAAPTYAVRLVAMAVRSVVARLVVAACRVAGPVPEARPTVPHHHR